MNTDILIGIIGTVLLLAAWLIETYENIRKNKVSIHRHFAILYIIGVAVLTIYSYQIKDPIFFWLNLLLLAAIVGELLYSLGKSKFKYARKHK